MNKQPTTIRTYLLRGAFLLSLAFVIVMPLALGQTRSRGSKPSVAAAQMPRVPPPSSGATQATLVNKQSLLPYDVRTLPGRHAKLGEIPTLLTPTTGPRFRNLSQPKLPNVILYDQYNNAGTNATSSQDFEAAFDPFDDFTADDFVVPAGQTWNVSEVDMQGTYDGFTGPAVAFHVFFYQDSGGLPGTQVYAAMNQPYTSSNNIDFVINLSVPACLSEGTYWVSVQCRMDFNVGGQWYWQDRTVQSNNGAAWENPGGGFGICTTWGRRGDPAGCNIDPGVPDQVYRLAGTIGPCGVTPTPTPTATATPTGSPSCTPSWQNEPPMVAARAFASAAVANGNFYVLAGFDGVAPYVVETDFFNGSVWATGAPIPIGHSQSKAAAVGNNIYVPGGFNSIQFGGPLNFMQIYDTVANTWSSGLNLPQTRSGAAVAAFNGKVYIISGFTDPFPTPTNTVYEYDPVNNTYTLKAPMPGSSGNIPGAELNGEIYAVGGSFGFEAAFAYNPTTDTWRSIAPPSPRDCQAGGAFALDGELWLVGCLGQDGTVAKIYNPGSDSWRTGPSLLVSQEGGSATALYNTRGYVAGGGFGGAASTTVESVGPCPSPTPTATPTPGQIQLRARGHIHDGVKVVQLQWRGATAQQVDIYRNNMRLVRVPNNGSYVDTLTEHGVYTYYVCDARTQNCSNVVVINY
jgi:Kelch motif protein